MSENERHCRHVMSHADTNGELYCDEGHRLVHYFYLQDARAEISQLKEELEMYRTLTGFKPTSVSLNADPGTDHLGVEQAADMIVLSMKGKAQAFSPKAILDLIKILKRVYNAANNYTRPTKIHSKEGIES